MKKELKISVTCPICFSTGLKSLKGFKSHFTQQHPDFQGNVVQLWESALAQAKLKAQASEQPSDAVVEVKRPNLRVVKSESESESYVGDPNPQPVTFKQEHQFVETVRTITSIPQYSYIYFDGPVYEMSSSGTSEVEVHGVKLMVGLRQTDPTGVIWLYCQNGGVTLVVRESDVFNGPHKIVSVPETVQAAQTPPPVLTEVEEAPEDVAYREGLDEYLNSVIEFYKANEHKKAAEKALKKTKDAHYDAIFNFVKTYGDPSDPNKRDFVISEQGYKAWLVCSEGRTYTEYNEDVIVQWCMENNHTECLKSVLDKDAWVKLKESGLVPDKVVQLTETLKTTKDSYRLSLTKDTE